MPSLPQMRLQLNGIQIDPRGKCQSKKLHWANEIPEKLNWSQSLCFSKIKSQTKGQVQVFMCRSFLTNVKI